MSTISPANEVLLAEEDEEERTVLAEELRRHGYRVVEVEDGLELKDYLEFAAPRVIISDAVMDGYGGLDVLAELHETSSSMPFIVLNRTADREVSRRALNLDAAFVLEGPVSANQVCDAVSLAYHG
jgi:DNA-binding NtrC family response regulator